MSLLDCVVHSAIGTRTMTMTMTAAHGSKLYKKKKAEVCHHQPINSAISIHHQHFRHKVSTNNLNKFYYTYFQIVSPRF